MELGEEAVESEIAKYMAHFYVSRGNKASTVEGKNGSCTAFSSPSGNRIADDS